MQTINPATADLQVLRALAESQPTLTPQCSLVWTALVDIEARESLGPSSHGERFIVPSAGVHFWGGPGYESLSGIVRPGGADRQLLRPDGIKQLHALYEMQTLDGAVLTIDNHVVVDETVRPTRYAMSRIMVTAPQGPHAWLNRRLFVGSLLPMRPQRLAVLIRAFVVAL